MTGQQSGADLKIKLPQKLKHGEREIPACETSIETILSDLKQRVLRNETLNNFKKEINQLVELIEKKDPKMDRLADVVGSRLAIILAKPEQEM